MAAKIRVLSDHTINQIAAGEVIENPASVVKELVENSLDAGSSEICIEIQGGGRQLIRISDNGCGMNRDDALLCLERHATSKLTGVDDIHTLSTMGFRGEAIPSIASISKFNLLTCPANQDEPSKLSGTMVIVDGGKLISCTPAARSEGTTVEVKNLFFNVPVRKKFLRSPAADANDIHKTISLLALGYPSIKFHLISDGKTLLSTLAPNEPDFKKQLYERIDTVLGQDFVQNTVFVDNSTQDISLHGVIGMPSYTRHNRTGQYLYINKRAVVSPLIAYAVKDGYGTSIDSGRFPVFVLNLTLDGGWVDVNVHPQKREVRLRQEQIIRELVVKSVRNSLSHRQNLTQPVLDYPQDAPISPVFAKAFNTTSTWEFTPKAAPVEHKPVPQTAPWSMEKPLPTPLQNERHSTPSLSFKEPVEASPRMMASIPGYLVLDGQAQEPFVLRGCGGRGGIVLIDQKNAHARIIFEKLSAQGTVENNAQQSLLIPHTIEVAPHESEKLRASLPLMHKLGIRIEEFGQNTFIINALPQVFGNSNVNQLISELIHDVNPGACADAGETALSQEQTKKIALAASRSAVSSGRRLAHEEGQTLIDQLTKCQQPYYCPSGKPIFARITVDELAKLFQK